VLKDLQEQSRWLSRHSSNVTSTGGEDGIIAKALSLLPERNFWCVEFGAWDGKFASNTYALIASQDYRAVLIEANPDRFRELEKTHGAAGRHVLVNASVGFSKSDSLDVLLSRCDIPKEFDLLSIDIDGNDYYAWEAVEKYRPKLVIIEFNPTFANPMLYVQKKEPSIGQGASPASLVELGRRKGYELIASTSLNLLFVASEHYAAFGIPDNSLALMRDDSGIPRIFIGYDGHVYLSHGKRSGFVSLVWHGLRLKESGVQVLPERLQKYPDEYTAAERRTFRLRFGLLKHPWRE
jgi:hypothetical protein